MADIAKTRVKFDGNRYQPGDEIPKLTAKERKRLKEAGALEDGVSQADVKKAEEYQKRVDAAQAAKEEAQERFDAALAAVDAADSKEATKTAEEERDAAAKQLQAAEERLEALTG